MIICNIESLDFGPQTVVWQNLYNTYVACSPVIPAKAGIQIDVAVDRQFHVYILASKRNGTLYTGVTSNLVQRVGQHKHDMVEGFTKKYGVKRLVYYEAHNNAQSAITRERQIKKWRRAWKLRLIEEKNPKWDDLYDRIL